MRIISGKLKGRVIKAPKNLPVRPTTDIAKTGLFNILSGRLNFNEITCFDLFTGTGSISYELYSRGCNDIYAIDADKGCIQFLKRSINELEIEGIKPILGDGLRFLKTTKIKADLIFADPPYNFKLTYRILELIKERDLIKPGGMAIIEHDEYKDFSSISKFQEQRRYGKVIFSIFQF